MVDRLTALSTEERCQTRRLIEINLHTNLLNTPVFTAYSVSVLTRESSLRDSVNINTKYSQRCYLLRVPGAQAAKEEAQRGGGEDICYDAENE